MPPHHVLSGPLVLVSVVALLLIGCDPGEESVTGRLPAAGETTAGALPDWLDRVYPPPGGEAAVGDAVQVAFPPLPGEEQIRLAIDGIDVTAAAGGTQATGLITYPGDGPEEPVALEPGEHTATAEHVRLDEFGEPLEVLDTFEWRFSILRRRAGSAVDAQIRRPR